MLTSCALRILSCSTDNRKGGSNGKRGRSSSCAPHTLSTLRRRTHTHTLRPSHKRSGAPALALPVRFQFHTWLCLRLLCTPPPTSPSQVLACWQALRHAAPARGPHCTRNLKTWNAGADRPKRALLAGSFRGPRERQRGACREKKGVQNIPSPLVAQAHHGTARPPQPHRLK